MSGVAPLPQPADQERWIRLLDAQIRLLERERQKLSAIVHHADAGFFALDRSARLTWASDFFARRLLAEMHGAGVVGRARAPPVMRLDPALPPPPGVYVPHRRLARAAGGPRRVDTGRDVPRRARDTNVLDAGQRGRRLVHQRHPGEKLLS